MWIYHYNFFSFHLKTLRGTWESTVIIIWKILSRIEGIDL